MVNGLGSGQAVNPQILKQTKINKASIENRMLINANKEYDKFDKSPLPDKTKMNVATAASFAGIALMAGGAKSLSERNAVKETVSSLKGKGSTFINELKDGFRGKLGYDKLKAVKDAVVENGAKILKKVSELPAPIKFAAAALTGLVLANRIYNGGKADGEHNALNAAGKAEVLTKMNSQLAKLNQHM